MERDKSDNIWYVYRHIRLDKNIPFYIGIGCKVSYGRAYESNPSKRTAFWCRVANKAGYKVEIMFDNLYKEEAVIKEKEFISLYGRLDLNLGSLVNMTDGGDGIFNIVVSDERRKKISENMKGSKNHQYGKKQSEETKLKRVLSFKNNTNKKIRSTYDKMLFSVTSGQAKKTEVYNYITKEYIGTYLSMSEACRQCGLNHLRSSSKAAMVANGKRNHHKNLIFKYVN